MSECLRFLASGGQVETYPFPGDGPVRLERFRRRLEFLHAINGGFDDDLRRLAADREEANAWLELDGAEKRQRASFVGLRVLPNPYASNHVSTLHDRAAFKVATSGPNTIA